MSRDYLMRKIARWADGQPFDEHGHALNYEEVNKAHDEAHELTSPYGSLQFGVGGGNDFWCFDWGLLADGRIALHACVNSETGSFIMDTEYIIVRPEDAVTPAVGLVDRALEWCFDNQRSHDHKGWNQDPYYFARAVAKACGVLGRPLVRRAIKHRIPTKE